MSSRSDRKALMGESKTKNRKESGMKKVIILTIVATVAVIAVLVAIFFAGVSYQNHYNKTISDQAQAIADIQVKAKLAKSKQ